jgi:hypothetical protein
MEEWDAAPIHKALGGCIQEYEKKDREVIRWKLVSTLLALGLLMFALSQCPL